MDKNYSKREIDSYFKNIEEKIADIHSVFVDRMGKQDGILDRIEQQTIKTNGRVNKHDWFFKALWWSLGAFWTVFLILLPFIIKTIKHEIDLSVKESVRSVLAEYNIE